MTFTGVRMPVTTASFSAMVLSLRRMGGIVMSDFRSTGTVLVAEPT